MITKTENNGSICYSSDNGQKAVVVHRQGHIEVIAYEGEEKNIKIFSDQEKATAHLRDFLRAMPMQEFLQKYKGILNQKGLAKIAGRSVNYMSHVATGRRPTSEELNKAIEKAVRDLAKDLSTINII